MPEDNIDGTRGETLELSLDDLDEVAGGFIFSAPCAYEVINHNGDVVERFPYRTAKQKKIAHEQALALAGKRGLDPREITWMELDMMRKISG